MSISTLSRASGFQRQPRKSPKSADHSQETTVKLANFYNFDDLRELTRYSKRLWDSLHSTDSTTSQPTVTVTRKKRHGPPT